MGKSNTKLAAVDAASETTATKGAAQPEGAAPAEGKKTRAPKSKLLDIVRGRIPAILVHAIRFKEPADAKNADLAKKYGTSVGKVFDIRKNRNFQYIDAGWVPSAQDLGDGEAWRDQVEPHGGDYKHVNDMLRNYVAASEDEIKARDARVSALKPVRAKKEKAAEEAPAA